MPPTLRTGRKQVVSRESEPELSHTQQLDALFRRHNPLLRQLCLRWTRGHLADAQDLLAEAYLRAVRGSAESTEAPDNLIAWISTIIANLARDRLRTRSRENCHAHGDNDALEFVSDPHCVSDTLFAARELLSHILAHVHSLGPSQRGALIARSTGEEYEAIAEQLGTSPANARKLVQTARNELRTRLAPDETLPAMRR
jgi:RNA polymerase sigma factor (sigma-70 family)